MDFTIRNATKHDMSAVLDLIIELAVFEEEPDAVEVTTESLKADGFGNNPAFKCFVAEVKNKMSDDLRILFTEYRQKRKGEFDSSSRRAEDLNANDE